MLHGIVPSNYLHEGSNPPPPLTTYVDCDITFYLSSSCHQGSNPPAPLTTLLFGNPPAIFLYKMAVPRYRLRAKFYLAIL